MFSFQDLNIFGNCYLSNLNPKIYKYPTMEQKIVRCWKTNNSLLIKYHDNEWGVPVHDDKKLFELLVLGGFQAGLTWELILNRREAFKEAFDNFDPKLVAVYSDKDFNRLLNNPKIIRNKQKIKAAIKNANQFLKVQEEYGSFNRFLWSFVGRKPINNKFKELAELPNKSRESDDLSIDLKKRKFQFVGPTICYALMQSAGLINDHLVQCFRYNQIRRLNSKK